MREIKVKRKDRDASEWIFEIVKFMILFVFVVACVYPFYYVLIYSVSDPVKAARGIWLLPKGFTLGTYIEILKRDDLVHGAFISVARTVLGTTISVICTSLLAFLMTRQEMLWRKFVYRFIIMTMYLDAGLIPWYLMMRAYGLNNTFLLYIIPGAIGVYNMILIKTSMEQIPETLEESASIEGAGFFSIFWKIILPLSKPIIATITVYCAVGQWNSWKDNYFLNQSTSLQTLQLILRKYLNQAKVIEQMIMNDPSYVPENIVSIETIQMAALVVTMLPILLVYPFAQKYFTKGIMIGAVKG